MTLLYLSTIEQKRKIVDLDDMSIELTLTPEAKNRLSELSKKIRDGDLIPNNYYRQDLDEADELLEKMGVMHLHLTDKHLLYVSQSANRVTYITIAGHGYVDRSIDAETRIRNIKHKNKSAIAKGIEKAETKPVVVTKKTEPKKFKKLPKN